MWHWGVRCYSSADLYNWDDLGTIIPPPPDDPASPLYPRKAMDRPHILYNQATGKFICWIKVMEERGQTRAVLEADSITGPYRLLRSGILPLGMSAGDFDLVAAPYDGKAYMYFERVHSELICADLTRDYADFTGYYSTHFPRPGPPSVREGIAYFHRKNRHYLATSGTTGYFPNPSEIATADTFHGPWDEPGLLHRDDPSETSFNSQISSIFKHPGKKDLYIALADRWNGPIGGTEFADGDLGRLVRSAFEKHFAHPPVPLSSLEASALKRWGGLDINTSQARHVWLPIAFDGDRPFIRWRDRWSLDEFD
ncbi:family 43 glycosylhydrolase [Sphingobium sufflavum]|uniref:family 43 glycosylhydrolase n=1 Tax=Sphingobium sufflavum TaxID=1129547 RepID=UPI001F39E253|nr:family 43 glycosylhydrolase [Sphingobium sufflavum]MCE7798875.1 family 43 glycosylhydrolase [Sphingobium sufflavum]